MEAVILNTILVICGIWHCGNAVWRLINYRKGYSRIRWIQKSGMDAAKLYNVQYGHEKRVFFPVALLGLFVVGMCIYYAPAFWVFLRTRYWSLSVYLILMFLGMLISCYLLFLNRKYGEYAYLTNSSLAAIEGDYRKDKCRFVLDMEMQNGENGDKYLNVYKGKREVPLRFKLIEKEEEVSRIINEYYR